MIDKIAEELESKGLYRRAASHWLEVFDMCDTEAGREWLRNRRNECLAKQIREVANENIKDAQRSGGVLHKR